MPTATFTADFTKWNQQLRDAAAGLKPLEVSATGTQAALKRMASSFAGADIIKQANIAAAAVKAIGKEGTDAERLLSGATKLTEKEQAKLNATLTEAIEKYKALGQTAPQELQDLADATKKAEEATTTNTKSFTGMVASYAAGLATFEVAKRALEGIGEFLSSSVDAYAEAEKGQKRLTVALQNTGHATPEVIKQYDDLAHEFQRTTTFSNNLITSTEALFTQIGNVGPQDMKAALSATTDLAEGLGVDLEQAATAVAKATEGQTTALHKLAPSLDEAAIKGGDLASIAAEIERHFGGQAAAALDTYSGHVKQLANDWDSVKESIGAAIANDDLVRASLRGVATAFSGASENAGGFSLAQLEVNTAILAGHPVLAKLITLLYDDAAAANKATEATRLLRDAKRQSADADVSGKPTSLPAGYIAELKAAKDALAALTSEQKKQIDAGLALHHSADDIAKDLNNQYTGLKLTAQAVTLYDEAQKKAASATKDASKAMDDQRDALNFVKDEINKVSAAIDKLEEKEQAALAKEAFADLKGEFLQIENRINKVFEAEREWTEGTSTLLKNKSTVVKDYFSALLKQQEDAHKGWDKFDQDIEELSHAFAALAQISGGSLASVLSDIAKLVSTTNIAIKSMHNLQDGLKAIKEQKGFEGKADGVAQFATGILGAVAAMDQATSSGNKLLNVLGGAETGAAIGSAFGPIGAGIGAALGALVGLFRKNRAFEEIKSIARDFGEQISKELAQGIEEEAKTIFNGSRQAAQIFNLDKIIGEGGGVTTANLDKLQARLHDVFSLLQTGELNGAQAQDVLNKNFQTFVDFLGGRVNPALKEIIKLNDEFGTQSKAIAQYVDAQANSALSALTKVITARGTLVDQLSKAKPGSDEAKKLQAQLDATPLTKGGAQAEGAALFGIFERLTKDGASAIDVLKQLDPVIESLDKQLAKAGLSGGAAFDQIKKLAGIATDEIAGPAFEAIQAFGQALEGLNNSGVLTQEEFAGLSEQITATYQAAVDALVKQGKDGGEALHLIAPQLQEIWELQQDFGYAVDESTQKLLDQAVAAGDVGEKHRSIQAQTLDVMKHLDDVLTAIGNKFGVYLPDRAKDGVDGINNALDKIKVPDIEVPDLHIKVRYDLPEGAPNGGTAVPLAKGGPVYAAGGYFTPRGTDTVPAMLTPGEFVVSRRGVQAAGMPALQSINSGVPPSGGGNMTTVNVYVNNKLDHAESQKIAAAIAPHLPGVVANGGATQGKWKRMTKAMAK